MAQQEVQELNSIKFENLIGGPLEAVVKAQERSSIATLNFLASKLIMDENGNVKNAVFKYKKHGEVAGKVQEQDCELSVPTMTLVPIPSLRICEVTINFRAKLTSTQYTSHEGTDSNSGSSNNETNTSSGGGIFRKIFGGTDETQKITQTTSYSHTRKNMNGETHNSDYSLNVKVRAVQDQLPAGLERVLTMMENCIKEKTQPAQAAQQNR